MVDVVKDGEIIPAKVVYVRNRNKHITWIQAFQILLQMFKTMFEENTGLSNEKISELVEAFLNALPMMLKTQLQAV